MREPNVADVSQLSLSPSESSGSGSGNVEANGRDGEEVPMEVDGVETVKTKSPERSRLLLSTTVVDAGPNSTEDIYDYGMLSTIGFMFSVFNLIAYSRKVSSFVIVVEELAFCSGEEVFFRAV